MKPVTKRHPAIVELSPERLSLYTDHLRKINRDSPEIQNGIQQRYSIEDFFTIRDKFDNTLEKKLGLLYYVKNGIEIRTDLGWELANLVYPSDMPYRYFADFGLTAHDFYAHGIGGYYNLSRNKLISSINGYMNRLGSRNSSLYNLTISKIFRLFKQSLLDENKGGKK